MVNGVFQHAWHRAVVLRRHKQQALRRGDVGLQARHLGRRLGIVVLVVMRQVVDPHGLEQHVGRRQFGQRRRQFLVERIFSDTADDNGDFELGQGVLLKC